jgi:hypothetical protein
MLFSNGKPVNSSATAQNSPSLEDLALAMRKALGENLAEEIGKLISDKLAERRFLGDSHISEETMSDETRGSVAAAMIRMGNSDIKSSTDRLGEEKEVEGNSESNRNIIDKLKDL